MGRLIVVTQLPIRMRYSEWWPREILKHMEPHFEDVLLLGHGDPEHRDAHDSFSSDGPAVWAEALAAQEYMGLDVRGDVLFHCDLSYPGIFHSVLALKRPRKAVAFCHATSLNWMDKFGPIRERKWPLEAAHAGLYDQVLVATQYHALKLRFDGQPGISTHVTGGLPNPPDDILPARSLRPRSRRFGSVSRPTPQKVNIQVEEMLKDLSGDAVQRESHDSWTSYFHFLDETQFLVITALEETYGYQVSDAVLRGCVPIAPRCASYTSLLPAEHLYPWHDDPKRCAENILRTIEAWPTGAVPMLREATEIAVQNFWNRLATTLAK